MSVSIRLAIKSDIERIARIHREAFARQEHSESWVSSTLASTPRILSYVVAVDDEVVGYIFWAQKAGFRPAAVMELDQIAVLAEFQRRGLGETLIRDSLLLVEAQLNESDQKIKSILVTTRDDNDAQKLYAKVLGVKVAAKIDNLYSATEVFMIAKR